MVYLNKNDCQGSNLTWFINDPDLAHLPRANIYVMQVVLSNLFYPINSTNNTLVIVDQAANTITITVPQGQYSGSSLAAAIQSLIAAPLTATIAVTYSSVTDVMTFTSTNAVNFALVSGGLLVPLHIPASASVSLSTASLSAINIAGASAISLYTNLSITSFNSSQYPCLARIPLNYPFNSLIVWEPQPESIVHQLTQSHITSISIELRDDLGNAVTLPANGTLLITLKIQY